MSTFKRPLLLLLSLAPAWSAAAEAVSIDRVVVTATRRPVAALDATVATTVVDRQAIAEMAPQTVMDALHGEPGTFVQQTTPGQAVVIVRGLKGSEVLHLVDGFRLNNTIFRNAPNQYMALVDGQMLEGIEVVRGPMSALYGGDAMGGVVHMLSAKPMLQGDVLQPRGLLRSSWSSADRAWLTRAEAEMGQREFGLLAGVTYQDVNDLRVGGGSRLPFTSFRAQAANVKAVWKPHAQHEFTAQWQYLEQPRTPRFDELVPGFGQAQPTSATFLFEPQSRRFGQLRWRGQLGWGPIDRVDVQAGRQHIQDDRRNRDFGSSNEDSERNAVVTNGVSVNIELLPWGGHRLSLGVERYDEDVESTRKRLNVDTGAASDRPSRFPTGSRQRLWGLYVQDDWQVSRALLIGAGMRYNRAEVDLPPVINNTGVQVDASDLSGKLGSNLALPSPFGAGSDLRWVVNVGRAFRAPNVFDLGTFGTRPGNRFNIPNPSLSPERVTTLDTGFKLASDKTQAEVFAFISRYRDKITSVLTGEATSSGQLVVQSRNAARQKLYGIEAGIRHDMASGLNLRASATFTRGDETFDGSTDAADRIPPVFGRVGLRWVPAPAVDLEAFVHFAGEQRRLSARDRIDPRINPQGTGGWATLNGRIGWRPAPDLALALRLENAADRRYREHGSGLDEPGRNWTATVEWKL